MLGKTQLDYQVSKKLGMDRKTVSDITRAFLEEVSRALILTGGVDLRGVCQITLQFERSNAHNLGLPAPEGARRTRLYAHKSKGLVKRLQATHGLDWNLESVGYGERPRNE